MRTTVSPGADSVPTRTVHVPTVLLCTERRTLRTMPPEMSPTQFQAWRALYRADTLLFTHLDNTLRTRLKMSYFEHEVLRALDGAGGRMRMAPLAAELMISR